MSHPNSTINAWPWCQVGTCAHLATNDVAGHPFCSTHAASADLILSTVA